MTPTELTPEQIVAMSDIIDKHYPNSDYVSYSDIRAMMTEYAASLNRQGWTRVEDGLPETIEKVLTFEIDEFGDERIGISTYTEDGDWYAPFKTRINVKYWMPLPNKPEPL